MKTSTQILLSLLVFLHFTTYAYDIGVTAINAPVTGFYMGDTITVTITNFGVESAAGFSIKCIVDGGAPISETYLGTIEGGESALYTFSEYVDFSAIGIHSICAFTDYPFDDDPSNDNYCESVSIMRIPFYDLEEETQFCDSVVLDAGTSGMLYNWNTGETTETITVTNSGVYKVTLSDGLGFEIADSIEIVIIKSPLAVFTYEIDFSTVQFINTSMGDSLIYYWDFATLDYSSEMNPIYEFPSVGLYAITLQSTNTCGNSTANGTLEILTSDINSVFNYINVFPNPANTYLMIAIPENENYNYQLYDIQNRLVISGNINSNAIIATNDLANGLYNLRIYSNQEMIIANKTVLVEH
ncbi:MAG: T9SS type A sorting domain-containing protein [Bacteroidetes bacterium]|nr:T9SS type A sorting domain-containing protein [Bacteroidota bacterium]MBK8487368.1 T9SS type A sorting domain-containing protein [Bacteroidota bacterium]